MPPSSCGGSRRVARDATELLLDALGWVPLSESRSIRLRR
jgi:hypothetical protein